MVWQVLQIEHSETYATTTIIGEGTTDVLAMQNAVDRHNHEVATSEEQIAIFGDLASMYDGCNVTIAVHNTSP